jgi:hypothetical protein
MQQRMGRLTGDVDMRRVPPAGSGGIGFDDLAVVIDQADD